MRLKLSDNQYIHIQIKRKKIKNIILRVYPDGTVKISAPYSAKNNDIKQFAEQKSEWIRVNIEKAKQRAHNSSGENILRILGEEKRLEIHKNNKNKIDIDENKVIIYVTENSSPLTILENWWQRQSKRYLEAKVDYFMPLFKDYNISTPKISIRKMKSLWGSCTPKKGTVRLNYYLLTVPDECIDYIVLHELTHLIHPDHGKSFKAFLTEHMPNWKERKKMINSLAFIEDMQFFEKILNDINI